MGLRAVVHADMCCAAHTAQPTAAAVLLVVPVAQRPGSGRWAVERQSWDPWTRAVQHFPERGSSTRICRTFDEAV
jgi:hypothetical protein